MSSKTVSPWALVEKTRMQLHISYCNSIRMHSHPFFEMVYVLQGKVIHNFNGTEQVMSEGDYFVMDFDEQHGYRPYQNEEVTYLNIYFFSDFIDAAMRNILRLDDLIEHYLIKFNRQYLHTEPTKRIYHDNGELRPLIDHMITEFQDKRAGYTEIIRCHVIQMLISIMRQCSTNELLASDHDITRSLIEYIKTHSNERCTLGDAAVSLNFSLPYISRRFKKDTGKTFSSYLQDVRINNSCRLLANTDLPIETVANQVGYTDMKHFHQLFRERTGTTPRAYRTLKTPNT